MKSSEFYSESQLPMTKCFMETHFHCVHYACDEITNICNESSKCAKHCYLKNHNHCVYYECDASPFEKGFP